MAKIQNLINLEPNKIKAFLDSYNTIITDCDGVLWLGNKPIEKSFETLKKLQSLGKKIIFVSNNSTLTLKEYCEKFRKLGFPANTDQIAIPSKAICWYLKKLNFNGKAFVVSTNTFRQVLKDEGIDIAEPCPNFVEETPDGILTQFQSDPDIKAVIVDLDVNVNWLKISKSINFLKNKEILFLVGAMDRKIPIASNMTALAISPFVDIISQETNRTPIQFAKPSEIMKDYVIENLKIDNPSRCLFVGDSLLNDMKFADLCGFGKLWVTSGIDKLELITSDQCPFTDDDDFSIPDYYLPSLGHLFDVLDC